MTKKDTKQTTIILETSATYGLPISKAIEDFVKEFKKDKLKVFKIPEMVLLEVQNQMWRSFEEAAKSFTSGIKNLSKLKIFDDKKLEALDKPFKKKKEEIYEYVNNKFKKLNIEVMNTPIEQIKWEDLIKKASFRELPFERGKKEKGFKDMIIAQTIIHNLPKLLEKGEVVFICKDGKLREYIEKETKKTKTFKIYSSLLDFKSDIKLSLVISGKKSIDDIRDEAELAFYNEDDKDNSLFFRDNIKEKIVEKYSNLLSNPELKDDSGLLIWQEIYGDTAEGDRKYIPIGFPEYRVSKPIFIKKKSDLEYIWESTILFRQIFEPVSYSQWHGTYLYTLNFKVTWKSIFSEDGSIDKDKNKFLDVDYIKNDTYVNWAKANISGASISPSFSPAASGNQDNLTASGQGTTPVASDIAHLIPSSSPSSENE